MVIDPYGEQPKMVKAGSDSLKRLRKKVADSLTTPARGAIIPTGIIGLDLILQGGVNFGSAHEFYGLSQSAKSYIMQRIAVTAQTYFDDCIVVVLDRENAYDEQRVLSVGFDRDRLIIIPSRKIPEPDHVFDVMRECLNDIDKMVATEESDEEKAAPKRKKDVLYGREFRQSSPHVVFIIDSVPAFAEQMESTEDQGRRAKKWHAVMRRITAFLDPKVTVLFSNHIIYNPSPYAPKSKSSGTALDLYRDSGVQLSKMYDIVSDDGITIGTMIEAVVDKTRRSASCASTFFPLFFKGGAPRYSGILPYMEYLKLAEIRNKTTYEKEKKKGNVWANYEVKGIPGTISERDASLLEDFIKQHNIIELIHEREKEVLV